MEESDNKNIELELPYFMARAIKSYYENLRQYYGSQIYEAQEDLAWAEKNLPSKHHTYGIELNRQKALLANVESKYNLAMENLAKMTGFDVETLKKVDTSIR